MTEGTGTFRGRGEAMCKHGKELNLVNSKEGVKSAMGGSEV